MTPEEIEDELIQIVQMGHDPIAQELALKKLKARSGITLGTLRTRLAKMTENLNAERSAQTVDPLVSKINEDWFLLNADEGVQFCRWKDDRLLPYSKTHFAIAVAPLSPQTGHNAPSEVYIRAPHRREYDGVTIDPEGGDVVDGKVNMWRGYAVEPKAGDVSLWHRYLKAVFGENWEYVENWCALTVQKPAQRTGVTLYLISQEEGSGKSTLGLILRRMFPRAHAVVAKRSSDIMGDFNGHLAQALFVHGDEITFRGDRKGARAMKGMITDDRLLINGKYKAAFEVENLMSILMTTNDLHAAPVGMSDRRYAMLEAAPTLRGDRTFWEAFYGWLDGDGLAAILHHLLAKDIAGFDPVRDRPLTSVYALNKRESQQQVGRWLTECIDRGELREAGGPVYSYEEGKEIEKARVYEAYADWQKAERGYDNPVGRNQFWKELRAMGMIASERRDAHRKREDRTAWVTLKTWDEMEKAMEDALA